MAETTSEPKNNGPASDGSLVKIAKFGNRCPLKMIGTVDGEKDHHPQNTQPTHAPVGPPHHLNWPRQQRPPDPRGLNPQAGARPPPHQGVRRVSPWAVLRTKLPDQQGLRPPGLEHAIYRMQNPEDLMRPRAPPDINGYSRPPLSRPPSGQLSKPPSLEGPNPPGPTPPRSPFLQRADSRTGSPMFSPMGAPGMMTPPPVGGMSPRPPSLSPRPPIVNRLSREEDDEDIPNSPGSMGSRPGSAARFPTPPLVRTPSGPPGGVGSLPSRPPSRTPPPPAMSPQPGIATSPNPPRTTPPGRQPSVTSLSGQSDQSLKPDNLSETDSIKSSTPSPRPLSAATSQESDNPPQPTKPAVIETKPEPTAGEAQSGLNTVNDDPAPKEPSQNNSIANKEDENLKRPTSLETNKKEGHEVLRDTPSDSKDAPTSSEGSKETVVNGSHDSPKKLPPKGAAPKKLGTVPSAAKSPSKSLPKTPDTPGTSEKKKLPMNKIQVGAAPSPNLKVVKSKIGSLENAKHKPGGGHVKIESRKLEFKAAPKIEAKNDTYTPGGGEKKIQQTKLQWNAKSKIGSLENATHKPGGGDKKIESLKLDFKDKAKPKVGSKDNLKHVPGGGQVKIEDQKLEIKAQSRVGSLDNVKYKPGGGEVKIFDDKEYKKQTMGSSSDVHSASNQVRRTSRSSSSSRTRLSGSKSGTRENLTDDLYSPEKPPSKPLAKPTDQNSNQLSRAQNETTDREDSKQHEDLGKNNDVTNAINDKNPPPPPTKSDSVAALPSNPGEPPSIQHKEDLHAAVIEKSQTEMPEKEFANP